MTSKVFRNYHNAAMYLMKNEQCTIEAVDNYFVTRAMTGQSWEHDARTEFLILAQQTCKRCNRVKVHFCIDHTEHNKEPMYGLLQKPLINQHEAG